MIYIRLNIHKYIRLINKLCKYMKKGRLLYSSLPPTNRITVFSTLLGQNRPIYKPLFFRRQGYSSSKNR